MTPLYIAATDTIIRSEATRYVHPVTNEVYGRSDYSDPVKLAEIGAVSLREIMPADGNTAEAWEIVDDPENAGGKLRRPTREIAPDIEDVKAQRIESIKASAAMALRESDWRMLRALEQAMVTVLPAEDKILADEREAIRMASDTAEAAVYEAATLTELKAVAAFEPTVIEGVKG